jgi:type VI secretion system protein ImpF
MAELSLRERLQPTLLDRLVDEERMLTVFELVVGLEDLRRLGLSVGELASFVAAQGLSRRGQPEAVTLDDAGAAAGAGPTHLRLQFTAPEGRVSASRLRDLPLKTRAAPQGVALRSFCRVDVQNELNVTAEPPEQRYVSQRRLREVVCRDLAMLLNSTSIECSYDLGALAHVRESVLNYGMPPLAGRAPGSIDLDAIARTIESVIRQFEPRLSQVRVLPDAQRSAGDHHLSLRIDAQLWGQPMPQHLVLRTRISTDSGDFSIAESGVA